MGQGAGFVAENGEFRGQFRQYLLGRAGSRGMGQGQLRNGAFGIRGF